MIRRILVGLGDRVYSAAATQMAIELAKNHGAELTGISVLDEQRIGATGPVPIGGGHLAHELRTHRLADVRRVIEEVGSEFQTACQQAGVPSRVVNGEGDPYECIATEVRYNDFFVCGLQHLFEHGIVDEPPDELIRLVQAGVRPLITVTDEHRPVEKVLITYSGSIASAKAMKRFAQLNPWPKMTGRIVVFDEPHGDAEQLLADALSYCRAHDLNVDGEHSPQFAQDGILAYANDWQADLIVMGSSSHSILVRKIFGETMLHLVRHTDRPLFLLQ